MKPIKTECPGSLNVSEKTLRTGAEQSMSAVNDIISADDYLINQAIARANTERIRTPHYSGSIIVDGQPQAASVSHGLWTWRGS